MCDDGRDSEYFLFNPNSIQVRTQVRQRRIMYRRFVELLDVKPETTILDVGVTSDRLYGSSNYLEAWHPHLQRITALGLADAIVDLVETGRTLAENGLKVIEVITESTGRLVVNRASYQLKAEEVARLTTSLSNVLEGGTAP